MFFLPPRLIFGGLSLTSMFLVLTAIYIEPFASMNPCPMCLLQRAVFIAVAVIGGFAFIFQPHGALKKVFALFTAIAGIVGASIAGRQIWLQHLPEDQVPACGPGLEYMLDVFPLFEALRMALQGTGDCAEVQWMWLGLSIPGWSLLAFSAISLAGLYLLFQRRN